MVCSTSKTRCWAHPRRCGADVLIQAAEDPQVGSSPQVRGRPGRCCGCFKLRRLIPAGAGQTTSWSVIGSAIGAHSRRCGADAKLRAGAHQDMGSSPQVRGRRIPDVVIAGVLGLIPAGAGQTSASPRTPTASTAHPRRCGADRPRASASASVFGSSPQVRGRLGGLDALGRLCRLIPAGAGQTAAGCARSARWRAHPRRCGAD